MVTTFIKAHLVKNNGDINHTVICCTNNTICYFDELSTIINVHAHFGIINFGKSSKRGLNFPLELTHCIAPHVGYISLCHNLFSKQHLNG